MANELTRVLQQGGSGGFTDDALERLLAGSLHSGPDTASYDVARDYIKQVLGQLYGDGDTASSSSAADAAVDSKRKPANAAAALTHSSTESSNDGAPCGLPGPGPSRTPAHHVAQTAASIGGLTPPPWTAALARGAASAGGAPGAAPSAGPRSGADDEPERPRPRPHHGRIKEQLDLLQNADQLATIISVATTAATTAAAAAMKQTMQTPPPLPPGAYARMHAAGQAVYAFPAVATGAARAAIPQVVRPPAAAGAATAAAQAGDDAFCDDSPDPQPQQRQGALVSPHRRSTPMVMMRRQDMGAAAMGSAAEADVAEGESHQPGGGEPRGTAGPAPSGADAQARRQRLRWSQRRGVALGHAVDNGRAVSPVDAGSVNAAGVAGGGDNVSGAAENSNLRVVQLGVPRITARTPTPVRPHPVARDVYSFRGQMDDAVGKRAEQHTAEARTVPSSDGAAASAGGYGINVVRSQYPVAPDVAAHSRATAVEAVELSSRAARAPYAARPALQPPTASKLDSGASHKQSVAQVPVAAGNVPAEGFYVTGGESIFARAHAEATAGGQVAASAGGVAPRAFEPSSPRPRRPALPEDVQDAFRSTLAFIADPDGVRAQQHQPLTWAALADVEERKEAQREAEDLLGGAFDYAAVKLELERARRTSRLLQQAPGLAAAPSVAGTAAIAGGPLKPAAGGRGRLGPGPPPTAAVAGLPARAAQPRGDFAGLLPPPHSVWDVDEAWLDLDEFTKAVEAEVAYRAAAAAVAPSRRGSPRPKPAGARATATTPTAGQTEHVGRAVATRLPGARVTLATATTATAVDAGQEDTETAARSTGRKRTASPGTRTAGPSQATAATDSSPSPPRAMRKTQQATGPVRIAFGRRVDEPPKAAESGASKVRTASPPAARGSPGRIRTRTRKVPGAGASSAAAVGPPSPSSTGDAVHQVLSALASVLLSEDDDGDGDAADVRASPGGAAGWEPSRGDVGAHRDNHKVEVQAGAAAELQSLAALAPEREAPRVQLPMQPMEAAAGVGAIPLPPMAQLPPPAEPVPRPDAGDAPQPLSSPAGGQQGGRQILVGAVTAGPDSLTGTGVSSAAAPPPWPQPGVQPFLNTTTVKARPRFQYVVDTAHPPITRLPAWAASAASAEGASTTYAAVMGAAPSGLGFGTPTRRRPPPTVAITPAAAPFAPHVPQAQAGNPLMQPFDITGASLPLAAARGGRNFNSATSTFVVHGEPHQPQRQPQQQPLPQSVLLAPADLPSSTHILPPQAAAAVLAAAAAADAPPAGRRAPDPVQQWEKALLQAVEDEVVSRLAVVQLAAQGGPPEVNPQNLSGVVPPLVDMELSRRLVCDVLRDNLRSLLPSHRHQGGAPAAQENEAGAQTLEEVVAALAAMPALPPPRPQQPQQDQQQAPAIPAAAHDLGHLDDAADGTAPWTAAVGESSKVAAPAGAEYVADWPGSNTESRVGAYVPVDGAGVAEQGAHTTHAFSAAAAGVSEGDALGEGAQQGPTGATRTWQPVYAGRRAMQASQATQAAPDMAPAADQDYGQIPAAFQDAATSASGLDLVLPAQGPQAFQYNTTAPMQALADPSSELAEPSSAPPSRAGSLAQAVASQVAASAPPQSPLRLDTAPIAPSLPTPTMAAVATVNGGMPVRHALTGSQPTAQRQDPDSAVMSVDGTAELSAASPQQSPSRSQAVQAYGVQARGVQAHGTETRGVQAYGVVQARAVQAHGMEARGTQAAGVQERATQAAGVMDSSSQADPPPPHYLLQAALAAGLSYGAGLPQSAVAASASVGGGQPRTGADGAPVAMPRPFYLVPADNMQMPSSLGIYDVAPGLTIPPYARGEGSRPPLNIPGLSKLRDSSDVESSTDSMGRHLKGPGARARAAAYEALRLASRISLDSDDGLLQRSYAQMELAALTARPVRLEQHRISSESSQLPAAEPGQPRPGQGAGTGTGGPGSGDGSGSVARGGASQARESGAASHASSGRVAAGAPTYLTQGMGPPSQGGASASRTTSLVAVSQGTRSDRRSAADGDAGNPASASSAPPSASVAADDIASFGADSQAPRSTHSSASAGGGDQPGSQDGSVPLIGVLSHAASRASLASSAASVSAGQSTPVQRAAPASAAAAATKPGTPAVADDELVGGDNDDFADDDPDQIHSVQFESSEGGTGIDGGTGDGSSSAAAAAANMSAAGSLREPTVRSASAAGSAAATRADSQSLGASTRSNTAEQEAATPPSANQTPRNGGRYGGGGAGEAAGFALSDDELLDDVEVTRVLEEEDAKPEEDEDALEEDDVDEGVLEDADEEDEELRLIEGQVTVLEDSEDLEDGGVGQATRPPLDDAVVSQEGRIAEAAMPVANDGSIGGGGGDGSSGGASDAAGGSRAGSREASAATLVVQSLAGSLVSSGANPGPTSAGVALGAGDSSPLQRDSGSGTDADGRVVAVGSQAGRYLSDRVGSSSGSGSEFRQPAALSSSRGAASVRGSTGTGYSYAGSTGAHGPPDLDTENQPNGASGAGNDDAVLRASMERLALAGLAPLGRLQSATATSSLGSATTRATAAPQLQPGRTGAAPPGRPALAPLQPSSVQLSNASPSEGSGTLQQQPVSPSKPPSLANYNGPARQLWRPPSAQQPPQDPLMSSSETLMASSEASGPVMDPLSRALLEGQRRARAVGPGSALAVAAERAQALGLADSIAESSLDISASADSIPSSTMSQQRTAAGSTLPYMAGAGAAIPSRGARGGALSSGMDSGADSDEEGPEDPGGLPQVKPGTGSRRDGAVFRLRQYGARRRKLLQQIGVKDSLLLSSATSLSTESSAVSDSEEIDGAGYGYPSLPRGLGPATRRM